MSGIAGIYNLDGAPIDPRLLQRMTDRLAHRGPDGTRQRVTGAVGMAHMMLHTTPESLREVQPLTDERGTLCLTFDGRVDNRDELRTAIEARQMKLRTDTDAELMLRAYQCWEEACLSRIIGDFACAIWDERRQRLFCGRDRFGTRPFYYYRDAQVFLWASELRPLFDHPSVGQEPNDGMVGEYLAGTINNLEETLYRRLFRLPPAHFFLIRPSGVRKVRYWTPDPAKEIRYATVDEYSQRLRDLFAEAVRCRLRTTGPIGVYLSGGLDSSSVVGMAKRLIQENGPMAGGLHTFSALFPSLPCDESPFIQDVVEMWNLPATMLSETSPHPTQYAEQVAQSYDFPDYPNSMMLEPLSARASAMGCRCLLDGSGGDEWLTGSYFHYADLLQRLKISTLLRQLRDDARVASVIFPPLAALRTGVMPLLPLQVQRTIRWLLRKGGSPDWITRQFARQTRLDERVRAPSREPRFPTFAQQAMYDDATNGWVAHGNEVGDRSFASFGLDGRHPFYDQRLVEFALAIPEELRWQRDQPKHLLRAAMRDLLPPLIRMRRDKADFSHTFVRTLQTKAVADLLHSPAIASLNWIHRDRVRAMHRAMSRAYAAGDMTYRSCIWPLWMIFGIELWYRTVFENDGVPLDLESKEQRVLYSTRHLSLLAQKEAL